jgi:N-acetylated-alpha-linked acidic dipeptidase
VNLDMASMGAEPGASGSPSLRDAFLAAAVRVPAARGAAGETVYDRLTRDGTRPAGFGDLGGGSDHVAFNCHLGVPCVAIGAGGAPGTSYHSNYDTIAWYRAIVGADYEPALMVTRMTNAIVALVAQSPVIPSSAARHGRDALRVLDALRARSPEGPAVAAIDALRDRARRTAESGARLDAALVTAGPTLSPAARARVDAAIVELDRAWVDPAGLEGRPWFRSLLAASDRDSGYAAVMLPLLAEAVDARDAARIRAAAERYQRVFDRLDGAIRRAASDVPGGAVPGT